MIKPNKLNPGDKVALVAPSSPVTDEVLEKSIKSIRFLDLEPVIYNGCKQHYGYLAGQDTLRSEDLNSAFADDSIKGIFCLRGGYGATRLLPFLDMDIIKANPKVFVGYSDITALHTVFNNMCGFITFHGPMPSTGYYLHNDYTISSIKQNIFASFPNMIYNPPGYSFNALFPGKGCGSITGGNLSVIAATLGSDYEINTENKVLFLEEVNEELYRIDKSLTALALAGKFNNVSGIVLGAFSQCKSTEEESLTLQEIVRDIILPFKKPTLSGFHAGHVYPQPTIPMGAVAILDTEKDYIEFR